MRKYFQRVRLVACLLLVSTDINNFKKFTENSTTFNEPFYSSQNTHT